MSNKYLSFFKDNSIFVNIALLFMFEYRLYQFQTQIISSRDKALEVVITQVLDRVENKFQGLDKKIVDISTVVDTNSTMTDNYVYPAIWIISIAFILYGGYTFITYLKTPDKVNENIVQKTDNFEDIIETVRVDQQLIDSIDATIARGNYYDPTKRTMTGEFVSDRVKELTDSPVVSTENTNCLIEGLNKSSSCESLSPIMERVSTNLAEHVIPNMDKLAFISSFYD